MNDSGRRSEQPFGPVNTQRSQAIVSVGRSGSLTERQEWRTPHANGGSTTHFGAVLRAGVISFTATLGIDGDARTDRVEVVG